MGRLHCFEKVVTFAFRWPGKIIPELLRKHSPAEILDSDFSCPNSHTINLSYSKLPS